MKRTKLVGLCLGAVFAVAAVGCGSSSSKQTTTATTSTASGGTVNQAQVEQGIEQSLSNSSVKVTSAKCPSNVQVQVGAMFTCTVTLSNGGTGKATVTQVGVNHYTYALEPGSVQIPGKTADAAIEKSLAAQGLPNTTVNCPQNIIVKVGTTVTCNITGANGVATSKVTYSFSEANGTINPASVKTG
jgi:hypothetical protein